MKAIILNHSNGSINVLTLTDKQCASRKSTEQVLCDIFGDLEGIDYMLSCEERVPVYYTLGCDELTTKPEKYL